MLKKTIFALALISCTPMTVLAMANPASVFCEKIGGHTEIVKDSKGNDVGICSFDNGNKFDEWTLYRMFN